MLQLHLHAVLLQGMFQYAASDLPTVVLVM